MSSIEFALLDWKSSPIRFFQIEGIISSSEFFDFQLKRGGDDFFGVAKLGGIEYIS